MLPNTASVTNKKCYNKPLGLKVRYLLSAAVMAQSQVNRPTLIGGSVNYQSNSFGEDRPKSSSFSIAPYIGRSVGDYWLLGWQLTLEEEKSYLPQIDQMYEMSSFSAGVFARYTFNPLQSIQFYVAPGLRFGSGSEGIEGTDSGLSNQTVGFDIQTGLAYSPNNRWRFLVRLGGIEHQTTRLKASNGEVLQTEKGFNFNLGIAHLGLGAEYCF